MTPYPVIVLADAETKEYGPFIEKVFDYLVGCARLDVFIIKPLDNCRSVNSIITKYYNFIRNVAIERGFDYRFDINIILNQPYKVHPNWSVVFKHSLESIATDEVKVVDIKAPLEDIAIKQQGGDAIPIQSYNTVAVGGTFDHLHDGHKILLSTSVFLSKRVLIVGITGNKLLVNKKFSQVLELYLVRQEKVLEFLRTILFDATVNFNIYEINDICGPTGYVKDIDALVVSQESAKGGEFVNNYRKEHYFDKLHIVSIDVIGSNDSNEQNNWKGKLSSTDIRQQELHRLNLSN